jgi:hypothetical protein
MAKSRPIAATAERSSSDLRVDLIGLDAASETSVAHLTELDLMLKDDAKPRLQRYV